MSMPFQRAHRAKILVVEDDDQIADDICAELGHRGFLTVREAGIPGALNLVSTSDFDLLILDRMLGADDSLAIVENLRSQDNSVPILFVSAMNEVNDRIDGLSAGGDDYLIKPFALGELSARVEALLRRPTMATRETTLRAGTIAVDLIERIVTRGDRNISLLPREFRLLEYLMRRPGQVITREMFLRDVWHYQFVPKTNLVDVHIGKLRRKIDEPGEPTMIQSVRSLGFMLKVDA